MFKIPNYEDILIKYKDEILNKILEKINYQTKEILELKKLIKKIKKRAKKKKKNNIIYKI
jgi:tRNA C32,U32 (ribose-2'-O)-methylase TrmJ